MRRRKPTGQPNIRNSRHKDQVNQMNRITKAGAVLATTIIGLGAASAAHASVNIDATGKGFIGKGDVQTVLGYNNSKLQQAVDKGEIKFTSTQAAIQAMSQQLTQDGMQSASRTDSQVGAQRGTQKATQVMIEVLSCRKT